jgi:hypothetical protein
MKGKSLKRKLLIVEERIGAEGADYGIRTLQSKKKLTQVVTIKDAQTGEMKAEQFEVEGPVAYIETTTQVRIHDENATRCFEIYLDESEEQTARIHFLQRAAKTLSGLKRKTQHDVLIKRHHNMQRMLRPVKVVIPYVESITFPTRWLRTRRDHARFLNLIEVVAFLHQYQRPTGNLDIIPSPFQGEGQGEGSSIFIEATPQDYAIAYGLAKDIMGESLTELKKPQRELLKKIEELVEERNDEVTRRVIRERTGLADTRLRELLRDLVTLEYLMQKEGGQGKTCRYALGERSTVGKELIAGLTTPEELAKKTKNEINKEFAPTSRNFAEGGATKLNGWISSVLPSKKALRNFARK